MKTAVINFKVDPKLKAKAQARAKKLGVPLSLILDQHLRAFAAGHASPLFPTEQMTPYLEKLIEEVEHENEEQGTVGPFNSAHEAIAYLKNLPPDED